MARTGQSLTTTFVGRNKLSGPSRAAANSLAAYGDQATKTGRQIEKAGEGTKALKDNVSKFPGQAGAASAALSTLGGASGKAGFAVADMGNKIGGVAAIVATGGPLGIALAAATIAFAGIARVMDTAAQSSRSFQAAQRSLAPVVEGLSQRLQEQRRRTAALRDEVKNFGRDEKDVIQDRVDAGDAHVKSTEASIQADERQLQGFKDRITAIQNMSAWERALESERQDTFSRTPEALTEGLREQVVAQRTHITAEKLALEIKREAIKEDRNQLAGMAKRAEADRQSEADRKRETRGKRRSIEASRELTTAERAQVEAAAQAERRLQADKEALRKAHTEDEEAKTKATMERIDRTMAAETEAHVKLMELRNKDLANFDRVEQEKQASHQRTGQRILSSTQSLMQLSQDAQDDAAEGQSRAEAGTRAVIKRSIQMLGAEAAAWAMKESIKKWGWPKGLIIGAVASSASFAAVMAMTSKMKDGGFVMGGKPGQDSVPALLTPGEYVMSTGEVAGFRKFMTRAVGGDAGKSVDRALAPQARGGDTYVQNISNQTMVPDSIGMMRVTRRQGRTQRKLQSRGMA